MRLDYLDCSQAHGLPFHRDTEDFRVQKSNSEGLEINTGPYTVAMTLKERIANKSFINECQTKTYSLNYSNCGSQSAKCDKNKVQRNSRIQEFTENLYHNGQTLTRLSIKNAILSQILCFRSYHKRNLSYLNSSSDHCCIYNQTVTHLKWKRLWRKSFISGQNCCIQKRTNYMGSWEGPPYRKRPPWRVMFFGTDFIALETLQVLHQNMTHQSPTVGSLDVVTIKAQKPVRQYAEREGLRLLDWPIKTDNSSYDVGVLVSFGHMIPDSVIHMFPYGILNMHPSLLPRWRGASPIIHAVLAGDKEMGVSITEIRPKHFDIGPILIQREFPMPYRPSSLQVADILGKNGANMILETLKDLPSLERKEHEQEQRGITYAHKISKKNGYIDWQNSTAEAVDQQYRALSPLVPVRTQWKDSIVNLYDVIDPALLKDAQQWLHPRYRGNIDTEIPGTPVWHTKLDCIVIKCKEGLIGFKELTIKRQLSARDFHNGYLNAWDGTRFTSVHNELNRYMKLEKVPLKVVA